MLYKTFYSKAKLEVKQTLGYIVVENESMCLNIGISLHAINKNITINSVHIQINDNNEEWLGGRFELIIFENFYQQSFLVSEELKHNYSLQIISSIYEKTNSDLIRNYFIKSDEYRFVTLFKIRNVKKDKIQDLFKKKWNLIVEYNNNEKVEIPIWGSFSILSQDKRKTIFKIHD